MAKVRVEIICKECGKSFDHVHFVNKSSDVAGYEDWARENVTVCPDCLAKMKRAKAHAAFIEMYAEIGLPEITGTSEKQIKYAEDLREKYLNDSTVCDCAKMIVRYNNAVANPESEDYSKLPKVASSLKCTIEEIPTVYANYCRRPALITAITESDAKKIINALA